MPIMGEFVDARHHELPLHAAIVIDTRQEKIAGLNME
jgi:hypothetical protein